jgi:Histidine kinase-, DNA gyrase B-, and HSP90-like ATPase
MFEHEDWKLFRTLETISQRAGVPTSALAKLVAKELTDNALDATGHCQIGLLNGVNGFWIEDDGKGIEGTDADIANLFSIARPLRSSKMIRLPTRGALGNGLRVVAGAVLASGGKLGIITRGRGIGLMPRHDGGTDVKSFSPVDRDGTRVEVTLGPELPVVPNTLAWARDAIHMAEGGPSYRGKTSPWWYDSDSFHALTDAATTQTVADLVELFDGFTGSKGLRVAKPFGKGRLANTLDFAEAESLLATLKEQGRSQPFNPERLGGVGPIEAFPRHYARTGGNFLRRAARGELHAVIPFVVEAWGESIDGDHADVRIAVNRTPITAEVRVYYNAKEKNISLFGCGLHHSFPTGRKPLRVRLNVETPHMPIWSEGKAPDFQPFIEAIGKVMRKVANASKMDQPRGKKSTQEAVILEHLEAAIDEVSGGRVSRYSQRQLFYRIRPHLIEAIGAEPLFATFKQIITRIENRRGSDLPLIYRDTRGILYHPHTKEAIPLGTLNVEQYRDSMPKWTFNKVLYCEKEGFFPTLQDANWPERNDCALVTSKGFASRADRDVIDMMGESGEELYFFCIHDADAPGTRIHQALQQATAARPARKVEIVNLGLDPWEAVEMGLSIEQVIRKGKKKRVPVAEYVEEKGAEWVEWLQGNRVELNAMTTPQFLEWLDRKFAPYVGKVVPPVPVLSERFEQHVRNRLRATITKRVLREARVEDQVEEAFDALGPDIQEKVMSLGTDVVQALATNPTAPWTTPVAHFAEELAETCQEVA